MARKLQLLTLAVGALGAALTAENASRLGAGITAIKPDVHLNFAVGMAIPFGLIAAAGLARRSEVETALILGVVAVGLALWFRWDTPASNTERGLAVVACGGIQWSVALTAVIAAVVGPPEWAKAAPGSSPPAPAGPADTFDV